MPEDMGLVGTKSFISSKRIAKSESSALPVRNGAWTREPSLTGDDSLRLKDLKLHLSA